MRMNEYCECERALVTTNEMAEEQCCFCSYKRKYGALIEYNDWRERRIWHRIAASYVAFSALLYWAFWGLN